MATIWRKDRRLLEQYFVSTYAEILYFRIIELFENLYAVGELSIFKILIL